METREGRQSTEIDQHMGGGQGAKMVEWQKALAGAETNNKRLPNPAWLPAQPLPIPTRSCSLPPPARV